MGFSSVVQNSPIGQVGPLSRPSGKGSPSQIAQSQQPQRPQQPTYSVMPQTPTGKGGQQGQVTYPSTSGQQQMGSPNQYTNTIGQWDNSQIQPMRQSGGKGKGG